MKRTTAGLVVWALVGGCSGADEGPDGTSAAAGVDRPASIAAETEDSPIAPVEIVAPGVISTPDAHQTFPAEDPLTGDLWLSTYADGFDDQTVLVARRAGDGWSAPEVAPFSGTWGDRAPRFSPDGSALYFTSNRPRPGSTAAGDMNIWKVERAEEGWGRPVLLTSAVNSDASDIHASATASAVWVASNREGTLGRSDLFRVGNDGTVDHPGSPLNDGTSQPDAWIAPDETWMVLAITDREGGYGGDDLWVSARGDDGSWSEPVNLGPEVNSPDYEYGPTLSRDGRSIFFTSHREGVANVYRIDVRAVRRTLSGR